MTEFADRLFGKRPGEREARRPRSHITRELGLDIPQGKIDGGLARVLEGRPPHDPKAPRSLEELIGGKGTTFDASHGNHPRRRAHDHVHSHDHGDAKPLPASFKPERTLTDEERRIKRDEGLRWAGYAAAAFALDAVFHIAVPGPVDDVLIHGLALIIAAQSARGFNAYWRGYETHGKNVDLNALGNELKELWKTRKSITGFIRAAIPVVERHVPQQGVRKIYRGEGYPVSSVTYATENLVYGHYSEDSGPMKDGRKRLMSLGVLAGTAFTYTVGNALRWGIMKNFHDVGNVVHTKILHGIKNDNVRFWVGVPFVLVGGVLMAIPYATAGLIEGVWRYGWELGEGLLSWNKKTKINEARQT